MSGLSLKREHALLEQRTRKAMREAGISGAYKKWSVVLPGSSIHWTRLEVDLFLMSGGVYQPNQMALHRRVPGFRGPGTGVGIAVKGRVSIVAPSMSSRQRFHEQLWSCFEAQDWPDKELIVVETYDTEPSAFLQQKAKEDPRLVHVCFRRGSNEDFIVGLKRNMTLHIASGEFVANFDDDDIYAANYITKMIGNLCSRGLIGLTLSSWYNFLVRCGECRYSDPNCWDSSNEEQLDEELYGYGFSYVHRRQPALALPYPDIAFAEDAPFFLGLREAYGGDSAVGLFEDTEGICMHLVHRNNSTGEAGGLSSGRIVQRKELENLYVARLPLFQRFLDIQSSWWPQAMVFASDAVAWKNVTTATVSGWCTQVADYAKAQPEHQWTQLLAHTAAWVPWSEVCA